ncbi:cation diffusion facilitator family transporter [Saccharothrix violaceirubra]|uniref:Cation diffusion facilitator family transporter n=1 Tax=Saccharothrix violaceirubra TaxID=413306 RepID=A0A7W7WW62_9PSEU|nr:cation diffusion facilitator family transporter [Saccharothrix violaceirubra]MBB4965223.1 cation diffusion facilitator family transporter [Saccharothrix violaceirubra]
MGRGDGHGHGHRKGLRWKPHRHTTADRVDPALEGSRKGVRALVLSFAALAVTAVVQAVLVVVTDSVALLGDTIHNFADALTAVPLGIAFVLGRRAATRRFTYGLGRAEDLAGLVIVLLIAGSAALVGYESVLRLVDPRPVAEVVIVAAAGLVGFAGNELVARYRIRVGRGIGSAALVADGLHARTDGFASLAVVLGAVGVAAGFPLADPIVGLGMTAAILLVLRDSAREVFGRLLDAVDPATVDLAERHARDVPGVVRAERLRMRWIGHSLRAELAVLVDPVLDVAAAHRIAHDVEARLKAEVPHLGAVTVHTEPAERSVIGA